MRCGDRPVSLPEGAGKAEEGGIVDLRALQAEPLQKGRNQALIVSEGMVQSRGGKGYSEEADGRVQRDCFFRRLFSHHLLARSALLRHKDQDISPDYCRAGQTDTFRPLFFSDEFALLFGERREMVMKRGNSIPIKGFRLDSDPALPAGLLSAADGLDPHAEQPGGLQNGRPFRDLPRRPEG